MNLKNVEEMTDEELRIEWVLLKQIVHSQYGTFPNLVTITYDTYLRYYQLMFELRRRRNN